MRPALPASHMSRQGTIIMISTIRLADKLSPATSRVQGWVRAIRNNNTGQGSLPSSDFEVPSLCRRERPVLLKPKLGRAEGTLDVSSIVCVVTPACLLTILASVRIYYYFLGLICLASGHDLAIAECKPDRDSQRQVLLASKLIDEGGDAI